MEQVEQNEDDDLDDDEFEAWNDVGIDKDGNVYIKQIDSTQDLAGFFLSSDITKHIKDLAKKMQVSLTRDYKSTPTCF